MGIEKKFDQTMLANVKSFLDTKSSIKIGILSAEVHPDSDSTIATIGAVHEFGAPSRNIPERSFLRSTYHSRIKDFEAFIEQNKVKISQEVLTLGINNVLNKFGAWWVTAVNDTFDNQGPGLESGKWAPLSPKTLQRRDSIAERQGKQSPHEHKILMDTGALRRSITYEVVS